MIKSDIGINAGTVWQLLSEKRKLSVLELIELTGYSDSYLNLALGWLARENKVRFEYIEGYLYVELNQLSSEMYY